MNYERVAENVFSFQSENYAQVTAGVIAGPNWAVVIDTLALPEETLEIRDFVEQELQVPVRYVINTHYHADHSWGNCYFPGAIVIASSRCRQLLEQRGIPALEEARRQNPAIFRNARIILPHLVFERGNLGLVVGKKSLTLLPLPGNSPDGIGVLLEEDKILFAGDLFMPLPYIVDGNLDEMRRSLALIAGMGLENIIQGHGDIILRGEIDSAVTDNLRYLDQIEKVVRKAAKRKFPLDMLETVEVEELGKSRVLLGGLAETLHYRNLVALYKNLFGVEPEGSEYED
jgi:glyoxylase-like metal-dependent hydrolase (beta-lactamase superfamily II)